jgi:hypothetical protein
MATTSCVVTVRRRHILVVVGGLGLEGSPMDNDERRIRRIRRSSFGCHVTDGGDVAPDSRISEE